MGLLGGSKSDGYKISVKCNNCKAHGERDIPKGQTIEGYLKDAECRNCGCKSLSIMTSKERSEAVSDKIDGVKKVIFG